jgi:tyrosyl-DNA phosphodiesterase-1
MTTAIDLLSDAEDGAPKKRSKMYHDAPHSLYSAHNSPGLWQPFYLTKVKGLSSQYNAHCLDFSDLLSFEQANPIEHVYLMNYMVDISWMITECPHLLSCPVLCLHGSTVDVLPSNWIVSKVDMGAERYGTHHSKIMLIFYHTGMRVVVTTANFIPEDFSYRTQASYVQDFPAKQHEHDHARCNFEQDLVDYLQHLRAYAEQANKQLPALITRLRRYDFSSANVTLVASVPGRHTSHLHKYGLGKLCRELEEADMFSERWHAFQLVMQCSSLGSMGKDGMLLHDYASRMLHGRKQEARSQERLQLVWPTVECVKQSLQGYAAGGSLPCSRKTLYSSHQQLLPGFAHCLHSWDGSVSGRARATPHMKCYFRYRPSDRRLAWLLLTSGNLSQAAFGVFQSQGKQLYIKSYEMGVLYLPRQHRWSERRGFSCTPNHPLLGINTPSSNLADRSTGECEFYLSQCASSSHDPAAGRKVYFPVPFAVPAAPYDLTHDRPWVWDVSYAQPDCLGNIRC